MGVPDRFAELLWTVEQMREAQRQYERDRSPEAERAKQTYEGQVDRLIERQRQMRAIHRARFEGKRSPPGGARGGESS